jgi:hypothetical protein
MKRFIILTSTAILGLLISIPLQAQKSHLYNGTIFNYGGYVKLDMIHSTFNNGEVLIGSPMRDFLFPALIPVGEADRFQTIDFHVKESRFNLGVTSLIKDEVVHGFVELDFMLSTQGNEKVSNSYSARIRHFYFEWRGWLIGQSWSTFMIVNLPDDFDFVGSMEGVVFSRQPQIRYRTGPWWFALENPQTTYMDYQGGQVLVSQKERFPDLVARRNFDGDRHNFGISMIYRRLTAENEEELVKTTSGMGLSAGGRLLVGGGGDDLRAMLTYGSGLGRYVCAGFVGGAAFDEQDELQGIQTINGFLAWNHYWIPERLSSSFNIGYFQTLAPSDLVGPGANLSTYSASANLKFEPISALKFGFELMYAYRELYNAVNGNMIRFQVSAKYKFGHTHEDLIEK